MQSFNLKGCFICFLFLEQQSTVKDLIPSSNCAAPLLWFNLAEAKHQKDKRCDAVMGKAAPADVGQEMTRVSGYGAQWQPADLFYRRGRSLFCGRTCLLCQDVTKNGTYFHVPWQRLHSSTISCPVCCWNNDTVTLIQEGSKRILENDKYVYSLKGAGGIFSRFCFWW